MRDVGLGFRGALPPAARFATAPPAAFAGSLRSREKRRCATWDLGSRGALPPAARFATAPPAAFAGALRSREKRRCAAWDLVTRGALPPAARFATAPPAAFGGLAPLAGRETAGPRPLIRYEEPLSRKRPFMTSTMILTGCASGIGKRMAAVLYTEGHRLVLTDVNEAGLKAAAEENGIVDRSRALLEPLDVRDAAAWDALVRRTVERFGRLDVLMNIAGYLATAWAKDATQKDVDLTIDVNVKGLMFGTNAAVRVMVPQGSGHIVNIASIAGLVPVPGVAIYSASKHAARAYSIAVAQEVREHGVYVTAVCPTVVATPMMDIQIDRDEAAHVFSGGSALSPDDVVRAVIDRALVKKPLELVLPAPRSGQGAMAKLANVFPDLGLLANSRVAKVGRMTQKKLRNE